MTMAGLVLEGGYLRFENGRITEIEKKLEPKAGEMVIDAKDCVVMPGLIDSHCHLGMWEDGVGEEGADGNEMTEPVTPHLRAIDAVNPDDAAFAETCRAGVTCVVTGPGSANVLGGQFTAIKTHGRCVDEMVVKETVAIKAALGENPKRVYHEQQKMPTTRMATAALLRETLVAAQEYIQKCEAGEKDAEKKPERDLKMEAMAAVLKRELPMKVHVHRADDILTAIRIAKEFNIDITLDHCTEGYRIADYIKAYGAMPILGPLLTDRSKVELKHLTFQAPAILEKAGIPFALMTDHPVIPAKYLMLCAALAVREGLSEAEALKSVTINAARAAGLQKRIGSLEVGKDADIVIYAGDPLDIRTHTSCVIINGEIVYQAEKA